MITWLLLLLPLALCGQTQRPFDAAYRFADGVYLSNDALLANRPDATWEGIQGEMVQLTDDYRVQIDAFGYANADYVEPYAIALDGLPYYFVRHDAKRGYHEFAGLRSSGQFSTLQYDTLIHSRQLMKAYNPVNGQAFREAYVERDRQRRLYRILEVSSGRRLPLDRPTVLRLVASESDLVEALSRSDEADRDRLLRALEIYNRRYPLLLPLHARTP